MGTLVRLLRRITGISNPFAGVSWNWPQSKADDVPTFDGRIYVTHSANEKFISFLDAEDGQIVFVKSKLDASVATQKQIELVEKDRIDLGRISAGQFSGIPLPLPNVGDKPVSVVFHFSDRHVLTSSSGGTGALTVGVAGLFEVSRTFLGGPSTVFHLKQIDARPESRFDFLRKLRTLGKTSLATAASS